MRILLILFLMTLLFSDDYLEKVADRILEIENKIAKISAKNRSLSLTYSEEKQNIKLISKYYKELLLLLKDQPNSKNKFFRLEETLFETCVAYAAACTPLGEYQKALDLLNFSFTISKRSPKLITDQHRALAHMEMGNLLYAKGLYLKCLDQYEIALNFREIVEFDYKLKIYMNSASILLYLDKKKALASFYKADKIFTKYLDGNLNIYSELGNIAFLLDLDKKANEYWNKGLLLRKNSPKKYVEMCIGIAHLLLLNEKSKQAWRLIQKAKKLHSKSDVFNEIKIKFLIGEYYSKVKKYKKAEVILETVINECIKLNFKNLVRDAYLALVNCLLKNDQIKADMYEEKFLRQIVNNSKTSWDKLVFYENLCITYFNNDNHEQSLSYISKAIDIAKQNKLFSKRLLKLYSRKLNIHIFFGENKLAYETANKALIFFSKNTKRFNEFDIEVVCSILSKINRAYDATYLISLMDENSIDTLEFFNKGVRIKFLLWYSNCIVMVHKKVAYTISKKVLDIAKEEKKYLDVALYNSADKAIRVGKYKESISYLETVLKKTYLPKKFIIDCQITLGLAYLKLKNYKASLSLLSKTLKDINDNDFTKYECSSLIAINEICSNNVLEAEALALKLEKMSKHLLLPLLKYQSFEEILRFSKKFDNLESILCTLSNESKKIIPVAFRLNALKKGLGTKILCSRVSGLDNDNYKNVIQEIKSLNTTNLNQLQEMENIRLKKNSLERRMLGVFAPKDCNLRDVQNKLNQNQIFLEYVVYYNVKKHEKHLGLFVVDNKNVKFVDLGFVLPIATRVRDVLHKIKNFAENFSGKNFKNSINEETNLKNELKILSKQLLPENLIANKKHLIICPDSEFLNSFSFACLVLDNNDYFAEKFSITNVVSASTLLKKYKSTKQGFLGISVGEYKKLQNLKSVDGEIRDSYPFFKRRYPEDDKLFMKSNSVEDILGKISKQRWIHIASHGERVQPKIIHIMKSSILEVNEFSKMNKDLMKKIENKIFLSTGIEVSSFIFQGDHWQLKTVTNKYYYLYLSEKKDFLLLFSKKKEELPNFFSEQYFLYNMLISPLNLSTIILGDGKYITAQDLLMLDLQNTHCMVVSTCNSGLGYYVHSEVIGLKQLLEFSGVKYSICSLWNIQDKETSTLVKKFYFEYRKEGASVWESFSKAQRKFLRVRKIIGRSHPYFWAGLICNGNPFKYEEMSIKSK